MRMTRGWSLSAVVLLGVLWALPAGAQGDEDAGKVLYRRYCAACHGENGKGDGVVSTVLRPKPTDLTQLSKNNEGRFPFYATVQVIDGRTVVRAHGDPEMPVWGEIFSTQSGNYSLTERAETRGRIMLITEYLSGIQEK